MGDRLLYRISLPICVVVAIASAVWPGPLITALSRFTARVYIVFGDAILLTAGLFLVLCAALALGPWGRLVLGKPGERPEFSTLSWLAMLFAAGIGSGLLFWGVAEPVTHHVYPPAGAAAATPAAARHAMTITNYHWGLHAWACYGLGALVLAYFGFRRGCRALAGDPLRETFERPATRAWTRRLWAGAAWFADVLSVFAVVFGTAAAIMMGVLQLRAGLGRLFAIDPDSAASVGVTVAIMLVLVASYLTSAVTGLARGIRILSLVNVGLALLLMVAVLTLAGPGGLLVGFVEQLVDYARWLPALTVGQHPYLDDPDWTRSWSLTYFLWWIAWTPFVGVFIARISRGRTIREFIAGVVVAPTLVSALWFTVFGGAGIATPRGGPLDRLVRDDAPAALFELLGGLPGAELLSVIALALMFLFLITSLDSATYVLAMITSAGALDPPTGRKLGWGLGLGLLGGGLMVTADVELVKVIAVLGAIPFTVVLWAHAVALVRRLISEREHWG